MKEDNGPRILHVRPRYYRLYTDGSAELAEMNFRHDELDWRIPLASAAMVCVDVWNAHFAQDTFARSDRITREVIAPLLSACRAGGLQVIHAPASPLAQRHRNWVRLIGPDERPQPAWPNSPDWPPQEFRQKLGPYAQYARTHEIQAEQRRQFRDHQRDFHPLARPQGAEAVILDGEELHRLCAQRGILHLFYVGFHANACLQRRDYGLPAMIGRGYHAILVRDATTAMETHETQPTLACTRAAIAGLEMFGAYTVSAAELTAALRGASA